jgi:hypothetical protein
LEGISGGLQEAEDEDEDEDEEAAAVPLDSLKEATAPAEPLVISISELFSWVGTIYKVGVCVTGKRK